MAGRWKLPVLAVIAFGLTPAVPGSFWGNGIETAWALTNGAEQAQASLSVIQYDELEELVKTYSPQVQMERSTYDSRLGRYESAREEIMETRRLLKEEADSMEKEGDQDGAAHYRDQARVLEEAAKDMDKRIRNAKGSSSTMSLRQMEDTMLWTAQSLMGTYHSLRLEQEGAAAQAELKQSRYEKLQRKAEGGGASRTQVEEAEKSATAALNRVRSAGEEAERVKRELLMLVGFSDSEAVEIGPMPVPDGTRADEINLEIDKWRALGNNYTLRQERGGSFTGTNKELHVRQRSIEEGEGNMYGRMETLYQNVLASRTAWNSAVTAMEAANAQWQAQSHKMELGMLSRQEYLSGKTDYMTALAAKGQADVSFQQAMDAYDWAVKGLIY